jgi:hypothetical protein
MAARGQVLVPTLSGYYWMAGLGDAVDPAAAQRLPEMPPELVVLAGHNLENGAASMRAARDAGVKIALGSDMEVSVALEIRRMIFHGLTASGYALPGEPVTVIVTSSVRESTSRQKPMLFAIATPASAGTVAPPRPG